MLVGIGCYETEDSILAGETVSYFRLAYLSSFLLFYFLLLLYFTLTSPYFSLSLSFSFYFSFFLLLSFFLPLSFFYFFSFFLRLESSPEDSLSDDFERFSFARSLERERDLPLDLSFSFYFSLSTFFDASFLSSSFSLGEVL